MDVSPEWNSTQLRAHYDRVIADQKDFFLRMIEDQQTRWYQLAEAQDKAIQAALVAQEKAVQAALTAADKAVAKAEAGAREWQISANEWRGAMNDRERTFIPRTEHEQAIRTLKESLAQQEAWIHRAEGRGTGMDALWGYAVGGMGILFGLIAVLFEVSRMPR